MALSLFPFLQVSMALYDCVLGIFGLFVLSIMVGVHLTISALFEYMWGVGVEWVVELE